MPIRDLVLFGIFAVVAPMIIWHPYIGALAWVATGLLNPHRLAYGPAYGFPFAMIVGILTFIGLVLTRDHREIKGGTSGVVLLILFLWMSLTTVFALNPESAVPMWVRITKIFMMTFVVLLVLHTKRHIELLAAVITVSIGFYGVKGGIFTILTGGTSLVLGPNDTLLESNNHLAVANVMVIPLLAHFYQQAKNRLVRWALLIFILCCAAAVLGSYSRGAMLALAAMGFVFWWRSSHKLITVLLVLGTALVLIPVMPERWDKRMRTIQTYEDDGSAMSRLDAWTAAWNIATDRVLGGGFEYPSPAVTAKYSPGPYDSVAHSIYFQALGEHGFIGFALFMLFWILVWRQCSRTRRQARDRPDLAWAYSLMSMTQASLVGFAVGGAFINIAFWDMPYYLYTVIVLSDYVVRRSSNASVESQVHQRQARLVTRMREEEVPRQPIDSLHV
jgi:probable O-glycosylation ligase (exosortase A-associated)